MTSSTIHPRNQEAIYGHQKAFRTLFSLYQEGNLTPCWILSGQRGIGKATLAYHLAREILSQNPQNPQGMAVSVVKRQIGLGAYPNLLVVERARNEDGELSREITINEARRVNDFLRHSPSIPGWRVVIIDAVDEMNRSAANALLKILEEPPAQTLMLLICHSWGQTLPTIRSRCQRLSCESLTPVDFGALAGDNFQQELLPYVAGSIGLYNSLIEAGGEEFLQQIAKVVNDARKGQMGGVQRFCETLAQDPVRYNCFLWLIEQWVYQAFMKANAQEKQYWLLVWQKLTAFLSQAKVTHLDKVQLLLACFLIIENPKIAPLER